ncbi:hypothetical protein GCM10029963_28650 [Micromonospora andamanensis]|uniref:hypothetical protein n=1 Tax=Micromonospora andamanensis TaxID=1287068 RepID=UPI001951B9AC|nr:hypothetical protein [Micromonospora andamanensis]GIJ38501.1 hypothetical protein Vwe01_18260 [Micromonospora andamanensis]
MVYRSANMDRGLRERVTAKIYGHILDGMDVTEAVKRAADDARSEALAAGAAPVLAMFLGDAVAAVGGELVADMVRALAAAR